MRVALGWLQVEQWITTMDAMDNYGYSECQYGLHSKLSNSTCITRLTRPRVNSVVVLSWNLKVQPRSCRQWLSDKMNDARDDAVRSNAATSNDRDLQSQAQSLVALD